MRQPGDIVVVVPRWIIVAVGLFMLLVAMGITLTIFFAGLIIEAITFGLAAFMVVIVNLLILYIVWRFYWYLLLLGMMLQTLCMCTLATGMTGFVGRFYPIIQGTPGAPALLSLMRAHSINVVMAFALSALVIGILFAVYMWSQPAPVSRRDYDTDAPPRRKSSGPRDLWKDEPNLPHPHDPYWDDK